MTKGKELTIGGLEEKETQAFRHWWCFAGHDRPGGFYLGNKTVPRKMPIVQL